MFQKKEKENQVGHSFWGNLRDLHYLVVKLILYLEPNTSRLIWLISPKI